MEVSEDNKRKLVKYAKELFEDMKGRKDYPYTKWEEQYEEAYKLFEEGSMSQRFLNFSIGEDKWEK